MSEQRSMEQRRRRVSLVALSVVTFAAAFGAGTIADAGPVAAAVASVGTQSTDGSVSDTPDGTDPADTVPDGTEPDDTVPDGSEPDDSEPDDQLVGAGDPDGEIDPAYTVIAIIGFVALVLLASWWMVRRDDPDAGPMPPGPDDQPPTGELI